MAKRLREDLQEGPVAPRPLEHGWPADKVTRHFILDLAPYQKNARKHSKSQVKLIAESIQQWGWTIPILIDENRTVIAGHGRIEAAKLLGLESVPCMVATGWSEAQKRAYVLADNRLAEASEWDETLLNFELSALEGLGFDLGLTGFGAGDEKQSSSSGVKELSAEGKPPTFWISLRGPLEDQARVLDAIKEALGEPGAVEIEIGSVVM